jgi:DnaJ family protein C protein 19
MLDEPTNTTITTNTTNTTNQRIQRTNEYNAHSRPTYSRQTTPLVAGLAVGAAAWSSRFLYEAFHGWKSAGPKMRQFYKGGFLPEMTKREAAQILGVRESATEQKVREAHRKIMIANHPDAGGSSYVATKINAAKEMLLKRGRTGGGSVF